ncbi:hypothetical protein [Bacillus sp. IT-79MI2]|uniref:hypothetical protein n=1 Tax=Bacillus sp. IT-79MI2 TaxID=3026438 RepID=UPI0039E120B4
MFEKLIGIEYKEAVPCKCTGVSYSCNPGPWWCTVTGGLLQVKNYWDCYTAELCKTEEIGCNHNCRPS